MIRASLSVLLCIAATSFTLQAESKPAKSKWKVHAPKKVTSLAKEKAKTLKDGSVRLEGDVPWSEATLEFEFDQPRVVRLLRVELLPRSDKDRRLGRGKAPLWVFDIKPQLVRGGKSVQLDWNSCRCPHYPDDGAVANCIDFLTDTGWKPPPLPKSRNAHELVVQLDRAVNVGEGETLLLSFDSGGAPGLGVLARVRVSFPSDGAPPADKRNDAADRPRK